MVHLRGAEHLNWIWVPAFLEILAVNKVEFVAIVSNPEVKVSLGKGHSGRLHSIADKERYEHE